MARQPRVWYKRDGGCWVSTSIGRRSEVTGRRIGERNYDIGPDAGRDGARNRAAAELWLAGRVVFWAQAERDTIEADPTFGTLAEMYLQSCLARGVAPRTVRGYAERIKSFASFRHQGVTYGDRLARDFGPSDLRRIVKALRARSMASTWVRDVAAAARAVFRWAASPVDDRVPERILPENPFADVEGVKVEAPAKRYVGPEVRRAFLAHCRRRAHARRVGSMARRFDRLFVVMLRFLEATGCRPSEARRLEWHHIDWDDAVATMKGKATGATGRKRRIPIPADMLRILRAVDRLPGRHERFVFTHERRGKPAGGRGPALAGDPWSEDALKLRFARLRDEAAGAGLGVEGIEKMTLYQFRRDLGADILRMTGSYAASAEVLGHSVAMNERYYSSFEDRKAVELAERAAASRKGKPSDPS